MSIRTRLTLWYTGLLAISLLVIGVLIYTLVGRILLTNLDERLIAQAEDVIASRPRMTRSRSCCWVAPTTAADRRHGLQYFIQIVQLDGRVQLRRTWAGSVSPRRSSCAGTSPMSRAGRPCDERRLPSISLPIPLKGNVGLSASSKSRPSRRAPQMRRRPPRASCSAACWRCCWLRSAAISWHGQPLAPSLMETAQRITGTEDLSQSASWLMPWR